MVNPSSVNLLNQPSANVDFSDPSRYQADQNDNPYYLHNTDHPGLVLVSDRLTTASEFHSWRRSIRMALNVRNKLGFIDGMIAKPSLNPRDYGVWSRCNDMIATWLMNSVSKKIGQSLLLQSVRFRISLCVYLTKCSIS